MSSLRYRTQHGKNIPQHIKDQERCDYQPPDKSLTGKQLYLPAAYADNCFQIQHQKQECNERHCRIIAEGCDDTKMEQIVHAPGISAARTPESRHFMHIAFGEVLLKSYYIVPESEQDSDRQRRRKSYYYSQSFRHILLDEKSAVLKALCPLLE